MKKYFFERFAAFSFIAIMFISLASFMHINAESKTVTGEILDMKCYMSSGEHGSSHKQCAVTCIKGGSPMGILTDDGKVYLLIEDSNNSDAYSEAKKYAGEKVTLTGTEADKAGVEALIVTDVKAKM